MNAEQTIDTAKSLQRVQNYLERLEVAKGYHKEYIHAFIGKDGEEIPLLVADLKALLQQVAATQNTKHGLDDRDAFERSYAEHVIAYVGLDDHVDDVAQRVKNGREGNHYKHSHDAGAWVGWRLAMAAQAKQGGAA